MRLIAFNLGRARSCYLRTGTDLWRWGSDSEVAGPASQLELGPHSQLNVGVGEMCLDRTFADVQALCDLHRGLSLDGQKDNFAFAPRQRLGPDTKRRPAGPALGASEEDLDLLENRFGVADPGPMVGSGQFDEFRIGNPLREVSGVGHIEPSLLRPVED